jgi:hypothetical protein
MMIPHASNADVALLALVSGGIIGLYAHEVLHTVPLRLGGWPFEYAFRVGGPTWVPRPARALLWGRVGVRPEVFVLRIPHATMQVTAVAPVLLVVVGAILIAAPLPTAIRVAGVGVAAAGVPSENDVRFLFGRGERRTLHTNIASSHHSHRLAEGVTDPWVRTREVEG